MYINQVSKVGSYDSNVARINNEIKPKIAENSSSELTLANFVKPFKIDLYKVYDKKDELAKTVNETSVLIKNISNSLSEKRANSLLSNGFDIDNIDMKSIAEIISKGDIKALSKVNTKLKKTDLFVSKLSKYNLPINNININKLRYASNVVKSLENAGSDGRISVLSAIENNGDASLKNIDSALKVGKKGKSKVGISDDKIKSHLIGIGIKPDDEKVEIAKSLMSSEVAVNKENMLFASGDNKLINEDEVLDKVCGNISLLESEMNVKLDGLSLDTVQLSKLIKDVRSISDDDIKNAIEKNRFHNIREILEARNSEINEENTQVSEPIEEGITSGNRELVLKRQIEEIRLKLSIENARKLEKQGIKIDTEEISKLIDELRELERSDLEKELSLASEKPSLAEINKVYDDRVLVEKLLSESRIIEFSREAHSINIQKEARMGKYLLTEIRADLGDSVVKSFEGIESRLKSLGIKISESSINACKSLIRSGLDVTGENILEVEIVSEQLDYLSKNLTPKTLLKMNRAGIDIKSLPISEVVKISKMYEPFGAKERFARLIAKTDSSENDYKEIMSTYKAIYKGIKKDGVAISNLIKSGVDINLRNLKIFSGYKAYSQNVNKLVDANMGLNEGGLETEKSDSIFRLEKVLVQYRLVKLISNLTNENVKSILKGSEKENLPFEELSKVLEEEMGEKEYFSLKNNELVKKLIEQKIPMTFSNMNKARKLAKNSFALIDDINYALNDLEDISEKERITKELKEALKQDFEKNKNFVSKLASIRDSIREDEIVPKTKFDISIKMAEFEQNYEEAFMQLPYYDGGDFKQLNIFSKKRQVADDEDIDVVLSLRTKSMGEKKIKVNIADNNISLYIDVDNKDEKASFENFAKDFEDLIKSSGFYFAGISYSKLDVENKEVAEIEDISSIISYKV